MANSHQLRGSASQRQEILRYSCLIYLKRSTGTLLFHLCQDEGHKSPYKENANSSGRTCLGRSTNTHFEPLLPGHIRLHWPIILARPNMYCRSGHTWTTYRNIKRYSKSCLETINKCPRPTALDFQRSNPPKPPHFESRCLTNASP